jgi:CRP-like cAMP-binding protein
MIACPLESKTDMTLVLSSEELATIRDFPLFADLGGEHIADLLRTASRRDGPTGGLLFNRGDKADRFFIVLSGRVTLFLASATGRQAIVDVIEPGSSFGLAANFSKPFFPLNAEMAPGTRLVEVPMATLTKWLAAKPELFAAMASAMIARIRKLEEEICDIKSQSPVQRLAAYLLGELEAEPNEAGRIRLKIAKGELALRIGITRETLSRGFARLRAYGVRVAGRVIHIDDPAAVRLLLAARGATADRSRASE